MKFKKLLAILLSILMLVSLCSCGKMTAERLITEMAKALTEVDSFSGTMNMGMEMSISMLGETVSAFATTEMDISYSGKNSYSTGTVETEMTLPGASEPQITTVENEGYTVIEGDTITTYSLVDGTWYKVEADKPELETSLDTVKLLIDPENLGNIVLQEELDTYNGKEVYVLTIADCNYPEMALNAVETQFNSIFGDMDMSEVDLSGVNMQVTIKVYKDTKLPAVLSIDFGDSMTSVMESLMDALMSGVMDEMSGIEGFDISALFEQIDMSFEVPSVKGIMTFDEYNIDPIVVPKEALDAEELLSEGEGLFDSLFGMDTGDTAAGDTWFDVKTYVQGNLDVVYLNKVTDEYLNMIYDTKEELAQVYEDGLEIEAEYFASYFDIILEIAPEGTFESIVQLYRQIYSYSEYEVGEAVMTENGYVVDVTVYPIDIMYQVQEGWSSFESEWLAMSDQISTMTDEEIEKVWSELIIDLVESYIPESGYLEPVTISVRVEKDAYGTYVMNDDDFAEIDNNIIAY